MERRDYLELMTGQIRCKKMCPVIAKEVEDHIEDQKQVFMAEGMKEEEAEKAQAAAKALFSQGAAADMPTTEVTRWKSEWRWIRSTDRRCHGKQFL